MRRYKIRYPFESESEKTIIRRAEDAECAAIKLCNQYGWQPHLKTYDADTRGEEWALYTVETKTEWEMPLYVEAID